MPSQRWKSLERDAARALGGRRVIREDLYETAPDVVIDDLGLVVECKLRQRFSVFRFLDKVRKRYLRRGETEALVLRERGGRTYVCVPMGWFADRLDELRELRGRGAA